MGSVLLFNGNTGCLQIQGNQTVSLVITEKACFVMFLLQRTSDLWRTLAPALQRTTGTLQTQQQLTS
jgi:hypothetical protein